MKSMKELYLKQKQIWKEQNEKYFGITPFDDYNDAILVNQHLEEVADRLWNNGTNAFKELLVNEKLNDVEAMVPNTWRLFYNDDTDIIHVQAEFNLPENYRHSAAAIEEARAQGLEYPKTKYINVAYLPCPTDLCWNINGSKYVLRIDATPNYDLIERIDENTWRQQNNWKWLGDIDEYQLRNRRIRPYEDLSDENKYFLQQVSGIEINSEDDFKLAMRCMPIYNKKSAAYFKYSYVNASFDLVKNSSRFANPLKFIPIAINVPKMLVSQRIYKNKGSIEQDTAGTMIITKNNIFSLEMARTIVYDSKFDMTFNFTDSSKVFDVFKTSTNKAAGRTRLLLDNITVDDGLLWFETEDGSQLSQYRAIYSDDIEVKENLSVISNSSFNSNNDPKRIMMTAKLRAQAVSVKGEEDDFSHDVSARIVFGDFEGFSFGDAIVISRSFARKLCAVYDKSRKIINRKRYRWLLDNYDVGDEITLEDYLYVTGATADSNFRHIIIKSVTEDTLTVHAEAPFGEGDKLTNFHGSKGIACTILEDDEMPYLENDLGPNMPAGPLDVIASGLSVFRRKSLGQIFEAFALATGKTDVNNATDAIEKYYDEMQEYGAKSVVSFKGTRTIKPVGINKFIRLDHNAVSKQSHSDLKSNYGKMLKFGEMELLALGALGCSSIINELDIRSVSKHADAFAHIKHMQRTNQDVSEVANNLRYFNVMRSLGIEIGIKGIHQQIELDDISRTIMSQMGFVNEDTVDPFEDLYEDEFIENELTEETVDKGRCNHIAHQSNVGNQE